MSTAAERIYPAAKPLPERLAIEALRFRAEQGDTQEWLSAQETALAKVWDNDEDEVWNGASTLDEPAPPIQRFPSPADAGIIPG